MTIALPRGSSTEFEQTFQSDVEGSSYAISTASVLSSLTGLNGDEILLGDGAGGKHVGLNLIFNRMNANNKTASAQVWLIRKITKRDGTVEYILVLYGTLTITAGALADGGDFFADTVTIVLSNAGTRIEAKTGIASSGGTGADDAVCVFCIPDLDNAYGVYLDLKVGTAERVNVCHELFT